MKSLMGWSTIAALCVIFALFMACGPAPPRQQTSDSGVTKATTQVQTDPSGQTVEQANIIGKIKEDTNLGSIKHLYVISSYTGDVLEYSTVKGKVTSGGKRLSPTSIHAADSLTWGMPVKLGNSEWRTTEVIDEYGTYGSSSNYFYWFDTQGNYHQYFPSGGTYVHISARPLKPKKAIVTFEPVQ